LGAEEGRHGPGGNLGAHLDREEARPGLGGSPAPL